jgi:hypothetical protein
MLPEGSYLRRFSQAAGRFTHPFPHFTATLSNSEFSRPRGSRVDGFHGFAPIILAGRPKPWPSPQ